jgi:hypothetical protein
MNNLTEINISNIKPRSKIGIIGNPNLGKKIIEHFINEFKFDFNVIFSSNFTTETIIKHIIYNKSEEYNFIFNHLIKYLDYTNNNNEYLIVFDEYFNNNYYLQKMYFNSILTIISNNYLQLNLESMHDYIIIFYISDIEVQKHIYNKFFTKLFNTFDEFKIMYDILNDDIHVSPYISLILHQINNVYHLYYLKNTFFYQIEI